MTVRRVRTFRDLVIAALVGLVAEVVLALLNFESAGDPGENHPWLQISQRPGADIAERLFRHVGVPPAIACAILIQTAIFAALTVTIIYSWSLLQEARRASGK